MNAALRSTRASSALSASTSARSTTAAMPPSPPTNSETRLSSHRARRSRSSRFFCRAEGENTTPPPPPPPSSSSAPPPPPSRRSSILGDIVETTGTTPFPEPEADDFFQGDSWEWLGSAAAVAVPALVLAAVAVGAFAARTYDSGADSVLLPASGEDRPAVVVPVEEFDRKVAEMSR